MPPREDLKRQAEEIREAVRRLSTQTLERPFPLWQQLTYLLVLLLILLTVFYLLLFPTQRRRWVETALQVFAPSLVSTESPVIPLPPPSPQPTQTRVMVQPGYIPPVPQEAPGILYSETAPGPGEAAEEREEFQAPEKTPEAIAAYNRIREESPLVQRLAAGELEGYSFIEWKPVKVNPPEFWLDFVATRTADDRQLDLIWSINLETGQTRALSQAARDLEAATK